MIPTTGIEGRRRRRDKPDDLEDSDCSRRRLKAYSTCSSLMTSPAGYIRRASLEDLPEELLHKVISGLSVKEAGRTSILSSAWRQRWTYHSNLCFDRNNPELVRYDRSRLVDHVTTVLQRLVLDNTRRLSPPVVAVERFVFRSPVLGVDHAPHLDGWLGFAAAAKARHVTLDLTQLHPLEPGIVARQNHKYRLPADRLCSNGFESLLLGQVCIELPAPPAAAPADGVGGLFRSLKKLELKSIDDRLGHLTTFLSNCPALEWLHIRDSRLSDDTLVVPQQARCLRYLSLSWSLLKTIRLNVTSLTRFEYRGRPPIIKTNGDACLKLLSLVNLAICTGQLDPVGCFWDQQVSASLSHVHHLVLAFNNINLKTTTFVNNPTEFVNLRQLTLTCNIVESYPYPEGNAFVFLRLTQFLESAPQLEHFDLHMKNLMWTLFWKTTNDCIRPHVHRHLKTVHMSGMSGLSGQLELARYILLSAHALESTTLKLRNPDRVYSKPTDATSFVEFAKKYLDPQGLYGQLLKIIFNGVLLE